MGGAAETTGARRRTNVRALLRLMSRIWTVEKGSSTLARGMIGRMSSLQRNNLMGYLFKCLQ